MRLRIIPLAPCTVIPMKTETPVFTDNELGRVKAAIALVEKSGEKPTRRRVLQTARIDMRVVIGAMRAIEAEMDPVCAIAPQVRSLADKFVAEVSAATSVAFESKLSAAEAERDDALSRAAEAESARLALDEKQTSVIAGHLEALNSVQSEKGVLEERARRAEEQLQAARQTELELRATIERLHADLTTAREAAAKAAGIVEGLQAAAPKKPRGKAS